MEEAIGKAKYEADHPSKKGFFFNENEFRKKCYEWVSGDTYTARNGLPKDLEQECYLGIAMTWGIYGTALKDIDSSIHAYPKLNFH